ncbi:MAG: DUF6077 domain-containing protein [Clostridiales bacterium]|nr:DUF6077 domain-containing protein [Clostridiales bacterium]
MFSQICLGFIWFVIVPMVIGCGLLTLFRADKAYLLLSYPLGFFAMGAVFQIVSVRYIYYHNPLHVVINRWLTGIGILLFVCGVSVVFTSYSKRKEKLNRRRCPIEHTLAAAVILIVAQIILAAIGQTTDADDARFIACATAAVETDTMYVYHPVTGEEMGWFQAETNKDVTSPLSVFYALMSKQTGIHPAVIAHTVMVVCGCICGYLIYYYIGYVLFGGELRKTGTFLCIISVLNIFGNVTAKHVSGFFMTRLWQGKAMVASVVLPATVLAFLLVMEWQNEGKRPYFMWVFLLVTMFFGCLCSGMGIALPVMFVAISFFVAAVRQRSFLILLGGFLCCLPNLYYLWFSRLLI